MAAHATCVALNPENSADVLSFVRENDISFVIVGPEAPLAIGVADDLRDAGVLTFGPSKAAARLEASKSFTKEICDAAHAPTAAYGHFHDAESAKAYVRKQGAPIVVKADGLAAGKGVIVAMDLETALSAIDDMFSGTFGGQVPKWLSRNLWKAKRRHISSYVMGKTCCPLEQPKTTNAYAKATQAPTQAAWGPIPLRPF